ncbi:hypothetical protein XBFFL1_2750015 [Xenorhabdus bovienii str. feltiae Florida]|nr:hypothetical protein XBFFR1_2090016 [Xenorhabdus bovienii str. feltiae France]CDG93853.1 hypothetical protein XBFFL1_2750015 [Xenorhabdus bovienii str. feltiae Florida]
MQKLNTNTLIPTDLINHKIMYVTDDGLMQNLDVVIGLFIFKENIMTLLTVFYQKFLMIFT